MADDVSGGAPTPQFIASLFHPPAAPAAGAAAAVPAETPQVAPAAAVPPPTPEPATEAKPAEGEKSPLEILEEILASAGAEKELKDKEEAQKQAATAKEKAEMAAKEAQYREEAQQKIAVAQQGLVTAQQEQQQVDIDHPAVPAAVVPDQYAIRQLGHEQPGK